MTVQHTRPRTLVSQLCDADLRSTNPAIGNVAELITIEIAPALQHVEYMNAIAEGIRRMFDDADWQKWTA